jgi:hypothetical protein
MVRSRLSFDPASALHKELHIPICALNPNQNPAQYWGIIYFHSRKPMNEGCLLSFTFFPEAVIIQKMIVWLCLSL